MLALDRAGQAHQCQPYQCRSAPRRSRSTGPTEPSKIGPKLDFITSLRLWHHDRVPRLQFDVLLHVLTLDYFLVVKWNRSCVPLAAVRNM